MLEAMLGGIASGPCLSLNSEVLECDHSCVFVVVIPAGVSFGLLEWHLRGGNVIIRKAQKAIQAGDRRPRRRSSSRFPLL